jgi:hypothetical protein
MGKQVGVLGVVALAVVLFGGAGTASASSVYDLSALDLLETGYEYVEKSWEGDHDFQEIYDGEAEAWAAYTAAMLAVANNDQLQWWYAYTHAKAAAQLMLETWNRGGSIYAAFAAVYLLDGAEECLYAYYNFK